jgi:NAD(P)H-nitrite reductase large subunit
MSKIIDRSLKLSPFIPQADDDMIICRCEEVTKGEIRRAIHDGMYTLTEIRRYLRTGMGLCQGQTCSRLVKSLVAKEMGIAPSELENTVSRAPQRPVEMSVLANERGEGAGQYE